MVIMCSMDNHPLMRPVSWHACVSRQPLKMELYSLIESLAPVPPSFQERVCKLQIRPFPLNHGIALGHCTPSVVRAWCKWWTIGLWYLPVRLQCRGCCLLRCGWSHLWYRDSRSRNTTCSPWLQCRSWHMHGCLRSCWVHSDSLRRSMINGSNLFAV